MLWNAYRPQKIFQMKGLYLLLDGITLFFPLLLSFDKKVRYFKKWKSVLSASTIIAIPFLIWDACFTHNGIWGFNPDYLVGISIYNLPIEELLFFWVVPFACIFIYECCKFYFRKTGSEYLDLCIQILFPIYVGVLVFNNPGGWYVTSIFISTILVLILWRWGKRHKHIGLSFLISLLPFLIINGVLTGSFIQEPVVWYSELHISNLRIFTIPMEDIAYSFSLIVSNILLTEYIFEKTTQKAP